MFKIQWDKETGGIKLSSRIEEGTLGTSPRPVFWEELDLLKLNEMGWTYPHCDEPLLWAINKQYWYNGELVFEAKGANVYEPATVVLQPGMEKLSLKPVNVKKMLERTKEFMFLLESEAIEFIREVYVQYARARKSVERVKANQVDFEALAKRLEAQSKQKMAIVREDCDSFDIMPLDKAEEQGKKISGRLKAVRSRRFRLSSKLMYRVLLRLYAPVWKNWKLKALRLMSFTPLPVRFPNPISCLQVHPMQ